MVRGRTLPIRTVDEGTSAVDMAQEIFGDGVTVTGATYTGDSDSAGIYTRGDDRAPEVTPSDTGVILSTPQGRTTIPTIMQLRAQAPTTPPHWTSTLSPIAV